MRTYVKTPFAAIALSLFTLSLFAYGCGEVAPVGIDQSKDPDSGVVNDTAGTSSGGGDDTASSSSGGADTGSSSGGGTTGCLSNNDCANVKGQTPCRVAKCVGAKLPDVEGKCELTAHPESTPCSDPTTPITECQEQKCDANGECKSTPRPKTATCADPNLSATECQEKRCDGAGKCALLNNDDGTGCKGAFACGTVCKDGKCIVQPESDYNDDNPCTKDFCKDGVQIVHEKIDDLTVICDDGQACTGDEHCAKGECKGKELTCNDGHTCTEDSCDDKTGCVNKTDDTKCADDGNPCTVLGCDAEKGCIAKTFKKGEKCDDGDKCTPTDACDDKGGCIGGVSECTCGSDKDCEEGNLCLPKKCEDKKCVVDQAALEKIKCDDSGDTICGVNTCDPKTGDCSVVAKNDGKDCDDNSVCTDKSACKDGVCQGDVTKKCDDSNPCTLDSCDGLKGCKADPAEGKCDDGNKCTSEDHCVNGGCTGEAKGCDDGVPCTIDSCDETGACAHKPENSKCEDNNPCTANTCGAKGCSYPADDKAECDDNNACTTTACKGGVCTVTAVDKTVDGCGCKVGGDCKDDNNACTVQKCIDGNCEYDAKAADGTACDDGNKCNVKDSGKCASGKCSAGKPKDCSDKASACVTAFCDANSGACVAKNKADGTACQDGDGCTQNDKCVSGKCQAGAAVECKDPSVCVSSVCKSKTATTHECAPQNKPKDEGCDDGNFCTEGEACDGAGKCAGGKPKDCSGVGDACNSGVCDAGSKACVKKSKAAGTACDDGDYCQIEDKCDGKGACKGTKPRECPSDAAKCKVGSCSTAGKKCTFVNAKDGAGCNDGNACTQTDTCAAGNCKGGNPKVCKGDDCNSGVCDASSGTCGLKPMVDKTKCSDGNTCTNPDLCYSGKCKAGPVTCACTTDANCDDKNQCTVDKCTGTKPNTKCTNNVSSGLACNDGKLCTSGDKCNSNGACIGNAILCNDKNECTNDYCNASTGKCVYAPNTNSCSDGNACTVGDKCSSGKCLAGKLTNCADSTKCSTDKCNTSTGKCEYTPAYTGSSCEKGSSVCVGTACSCKLYYQYEGTTSTSNYYYLYDVVSAANGGSIAVGQYVNGSYRYGAIQVREANGNVTKRNNFSASTNNRYLYGATSYADTTFAAVGNVYGGKGGYDGWFVQFDSKGDVLSGQNKIINYSTTKNDYLYDVAYDNKYKAFWAVGSTDSPGYNRGLLVRINTGASNGVSTAYQWGNYQKATYLRGVAYYGGYIYAVGYTNGGTLGGYDGMFLRYQPTSSTAMKYIGYSYLGGSGNDYLYDIAAFSGYYYAVGRTTTSSKGSYDAWVIRTSSSGSKYYENRYGGTGSDIYYRAAPWGSGIAAIGYEYVTHSKTQSSYQLLVDYIANNATQYKSYKLGGTGYTDYGYGIAYTGANGGRSYALSGYSSWYNRGIAGSMNESGQTFCSLKVPLN